MGANLKRMGRPKVVNDFGKKYDFILQKINLFQGVA